MLEAAAAGATTLDIAAELHLPLDEVRAHIRSAIIALGARSKLEAVLLALDAGLIIPPGVADRDRVSASE
jgi:DNA-binding NarL/FixJ family response regulator